ncbi:MAG: hypothetical protein HY985_04085 [Magnetospirillum sp.]|nr:hypothetical protein [Magnetospirillum sp.]
MEPRDSKTFDGKVADLIAATHHLDISHILVLRRLTLADPEARRWATERQLAVVFNVILAKAAERIGPDRLRDARRQGFLPLLPHDDGSREEDAEVLWGIARQLLGPPGPDELEDIMPRSPLPPTGPEADSGGLFSRGAVAAPPKTLRAPGSMKEPPPLFAAQLAPGERKKTAQPRRPLAAAATPDPQLAAAEPVVEDKPFVDFPTLFDDTLCAYATKIVRLMRINGPSRGIRVPFLIAPEFSQVYVEVLRRFVLPQMRASRHLQALSISYNWAEVGGDKVIEILQAGEVNNPILHNWDTRWLAFRSAKGDKGDKGGRKGPKAEDNPWPLFREDATRGLYEPPDERHIVLLKDLIRYEPEALAKCGRELAQLYEQEFSPNARQEQAREGAFRDGIMKWAQKLPDHVGEMFAIRCFFDQPKCDGHFMRKLVNNFGRSDSERRRNAPFLVDFVQTLTE